MRERGQSLRNTAAEATLMPESPQPPLLLPILIIFHAREAGAAARPPRLKARDRTGGPTAARAVRLGLSAA